MLDTGFRSLAGATVVVVDGPYAGTSAIADAIGQFSLTGTFDSRTLFRASSDGHVAATQAWNCGIGSGCSFTGARPWLGFYLSPLVPPVDITGEWALTFIADSACEGLPADVRTRSYVATIAAASSNTPPTRFVLTVTSAPLLGSYTGFPIGVAGDYLGLFLNGGHDPAVTEELGANKYVSFSGVAGASVGTAGASTISTSLEGWIEYCEMASPMQSAYNCGTSNGEPIPGGAVARANCESRDHRLILTRR